MQSRPLPGGSAVLQNALHVSDLNKCGKCVHLAQKVPNIADLIAFQLALPLIPWDPMPTALLDLNREQPQACHCEQARVVLTVHMRKVRCARPACSLFIAACIFGRELHHLLHQDIKAHTCFAFFKPLLVFLYP